MDCQINEIVGIVSLRHPMLILNKFVCIAESKKEEK
jgi:hypothetical protein